LMRLRQQAKYKCVLCAVLETTGADEYSVEYQRKYIPGEMVLLPPGSYFQVSDSGASVSEEAAWANGVSATRSADYTPCKSRRYSSRTSFSREPLTRKANAGLPVPNPSYSKCPVCNAARL
jgi:hypothetical protein